MKCDPDIHHRRSIRLKDYDYSQAGLYFVTICTQGRHHMFGDIVDGTVQFTAAGEMVRTVWEEIPSHYPCVEIDQFVVMPNHFHGIAVIVGAGPRACPDEQTQIPQTGQTQIPQTGQPRGVAPTAGIDGGSLKQGYSLSDVVHRFKTMTTKKYVDGVKQRGWQRFDGKLWQRNYWEHIIRNEQELSRIRNYIENNPMQWVTGHFETQFPSPNTIPIVSSKHPKQERHYEHHPKSSKRNPSKTQLYLSKRRRLATINQVV